MNGKRQPVTLVVSSGTAGWGSKNKTTTTTRTTTRTTTTTTTTTTNQKIVSVTNRLTRQLVPVEALFNLCQNVNVILNINK
jgi:hypothetical protein